VTFELGSTFLFVLSPPPNFFFSSVVGFLYDLSNPPFLSSGKFGQFCPEYSIQSLVSNPPPSSCVFRDLTNLIRPLLYLILQQPQPPRIEEPPQKRPVFFPRGFGFVTNKCHLPFFPTILLCRSIFSHETTNWCELCGF